MIRVFGHYVSPALLRLLGAEVLLSFGSFWLGPVLWRAWSGGGIGDIERYLFAGMLAAVVISVRVFLFRGAGKAN